MKFSFVLYLLSKLPSKGYAIYKTKGRHNLKLQKLRVKENK